MGDYYVDEPIGKQIMLNKDGEVLVNNYNFIT